jgi:hypothetical protein
VAVEVGGIGPEVKFLNASDFETLEAYERACHKFCSQCGQPMLEVRAGYGYDTVTGAKLTTLRLRCPSWLPNTGDPLDRTYDYHDDVYLRTE